MPCRYLVLSYIPSNLHTNYANYMQILGQNFDFDLIFSLYLAQHLMEII